MSDSTLRIRRLLPAVIMASVTALGLAGCGEPGALAPSDSPSPTASASETPDPAASGEPTESAEPTESGEPTAAPSETAQPTTPPVAGDIPCSTVYTAEQLYEFNPNFAPTGDQGTLPGAVAEIADAGGTVCIYQHVTGSDRLLVGVLRDAGGFSSPTFASEGDIGIATTVTGGTAVSIASEYFAEERDARPVLDQVVANIG
ncbi:hypothetical protein [Agrococcus beijingensis]|uniref:hypothetical protein n=1 Tax=Agrococcus beijingensis TaxID=3068634 RepID=UPI002740F14E|nr:hypothetical protein [Agrococcus sp. REN33]